MLGYVAEDGFHSVPLAGPAPATDTLRKEAFTAALTKQLSHLSQNNRRVSLVLPTPRPDVDIPGYFATRLWWGTPLPERAGYPRSIYDSLGAEMRAMFTTSVSNAEQPDGTVTVIDPSEIFCDSDQCDLIRDRKLLFSDGNHPSLPGLDLFVPAIAESFPFN